jgi:N-acetylglucosamine-6-phosphate deacetylase
MITMATNAWPKMLQGIDVIKSYWQQGGKGLLGLHLEGPYINPVKRGAHLEKFIREPVQEELENLLKEGEGVVKMMTIAPEVFSDNLLELVVNSGIIISAGHSNATYQQSLQAFSKGIPAATHLFNAMSPFLSRAPGLAGAIYDHPGVMSSIICDGVHIDYAVVRISKKIMQDRLFFITDAVTETSQGEYPHVFSGDRYLLPDGTLSGSSLTMIKCVKNAVLHAGIDLDEALRMASLYPARLLGPSFKHGLIREGYPASFVLFDDDFNIQKLSEAE